MERLGDAGISLSLQYRGGLDPAETFPMPESWRVEADRWGHVRKMFEQRLSPSEVGEPA